MNIQFANTGFGEFDQALNSLRSRPLMRKVIVPSARAGLKSTVAAMKANSVRTHPTSMERPPEGNAKGPMSRYIGVRAVSAKAKTIGARTVYNMQKFPGFVVTGKRSKKKFFYPAIQEHGTQKSNPPIKPKQQSLRAANATEMSAFFAFADEFRAVFPGIAAQAIKGRA